MNAKKEKGSISRRGFLKAAGGVTFAIAAYALVPKLPVFDTADASGEFVEKKVSAWVHLRSDGKIIIYNPSAEMGQGSMTALPLILAEEMDADWSDVIIEQSPIEPEIYGSRGFGGRPRMITVGSRSVMSYYESLRLAGAQVRQLLIAAAAKKLGVPATDLKTKPSEVIHPESGRKLAYGDLAESIDTDTELPAVSPSALKDPKDFRLIGSEKVPRFDIPAKTNGEAMYSMDVRLPNMAHGVISRSPVNGARPTLKNESQIRRIKGVINVVVLDHGIGVIASSIESALEAKGELKIDWSEGSASKHYSARDLKKYAEVASDPSKSSRVLDEKGNVREALRKAPRTYSADYLNDHAYHAQMEPLNAVVAVAADGKSAEVWAASQAPDGARSAAASALGLDRSAVKLNQMYLGGGFGRRSNSDYVHEAALLAKTVKQPVKLMWTREDDLTYGQFRPASLQRLEAGVTANGTVSAWHYTIVGTGRGLLTSGTASAFYDFENYRIERRDVEHGIRTKHWRAVGHGPNKFAIESFIDEVAVGEGVDPYKFRRRLMAKHPRAVKVLDTVAEMSDWSSKPEKGRARGIAFGERSRSLCAGVCELSVGDDGRIKVHKFWVALDCGTAVQPDNIVAQSEGCILMALGNVLYESVNIKDGRVIETNFDGYRIARIEDTPDLIDIKILDSDGPPTGVGEAALPIVGGAVANALFALTGKRLRHIPFTPERVKKAIS